MLSELLDGREIDRLEPSHLVVDVEQAFGPLIRIELFGKAFEHAFNRGSDLFDGGLQLLGTQKHGLFQKLH